MFTTMLKSLLAKMVVISTALFSLQAFANTPYELTQEVSDKLFKNISTNQAKIKQNPNYLRTIVRTELMPYVHVKYAGSKVLGKNFKTTTAEQRERFFTAFEQYIEQSYAQVLTLYSDQKLQIEPPRTQGEEKTASIRVKVIQSGNQPPVNLTFYWYKNSKSGKWQVFDMSAEGVSMVETKEKEWAPTISKSGLDALTEQVAQAAKAPVTLSK
ncbi:phospholipid-binding protein MlaC [Pasteurella sp. PK-2025]|uniref:phospholipid-binding protein MlaC n=1 Tax=unclassified Pasteurella TaxID=2621516 RepID=UPI003C7529AD